MSWGERKRKKIKDVDKGRVWLSFQFSDEINQGSQQKQYFTLFEQHSVINYVPDFLQQLNAY